MSVAAVVKEARINIHNILKVVYIAFHTRVPGVFHISQRGAVSIKNQIFESNFK